MWYGLKLDLTDEWKQGILVKCYIKCYVFHTRNPFIYRGGILYGMRVAFDNGGIMTWYEKNREKTLERAKVWRINNLERYRALQKAAKRRKRLSKQAVRVETARATAYSYPYAPEGWEGQEISGTIEDYCRMRGIPNDPKCW